MVFVKVRETYDLHTVQNKMTVIAVHTPKPDIIKANFPGLLMQCKAYRPVSADVRVACASVLPLDPQGVGLTEGSVAPEDVFNPILYKACSNLGMSQIEARIWQLAQDPQADVKGQSAHVDVDSTTSYPDEFPVYYGFLSNAHGFRHANPQAGLEMTDLKPLVYEMLYNVGDNDPKSAGNSGTRDTITYPAGDGTQTRGSQVSGIRGNGKPIPFINCTAYSSNLKDPGFSIPTGGEYPNVMYNAGTEIPYINCVVGAIIIPPSRLHELFYRMVVEWTIEFSQIRPLGEITNWAGLNALAGITHYQNYSYANTKKAITGSDESVMTEDTCMVSTTAPIEKVF